MTEWLETNGCGGFASGTLTGVRTRRYHALLLTAATPPTGRMVLVNGFDAWIETPTGRFELTSQHYAPEFIGGDGAQRIEQFTADPWPRWTFTCEDGTRVEQEILVARYSQVTLIAWRLAGRVTPRAPEVRSNTLSFEPEPPDGARGATRPTQTDGAHGARPDVKLFVRPFLSGRDYHSLHKENSAFRFDAAVEAERVAWNPYPGVPAVVALSNGQYQHEPHWYRNFRYAEETARGLDDTEDLAAPGIFTFDLASGDAVMMFTTADSPALSRKGDLSAARFADAVRADEQARRADFPSRLHRAADAYIVNGRNGKAIMAGYPWFTDWGRDTFIALRGLCLAAGRLEDARDILIAWSKCVSAGMLPNRFPDKGEQPEYNSVDASLWYVVAVHEFLLACNRNSRIASARDKRTLQDAVEAILEGYSQGTRHGIRLDDDGLLAAGEPGVQLTWMDAKIGDWVVTPRAGKPVEIQTLWLNALKIASRFSPGWQKYFDHGLKAFRERFWNDARGCLFDVIDVFHRAGEKDPTFRPNQIFAVGGLPFQLLEGERAGKVVAAVEEKLLTPLGLRSLAPDESDYKPRYEGGVWQRDIAYHQGTVWPWLMGPFVEAWLRVRGNTAAARQEARSRFLTPILAHLDEVGLGHVSEIADADAPHTPRGCPFQAWSVAELLRLDQCVLREPKLVRRALNGKAGRVAPRAQNSRNHGAEELTRPARNGARGAARPTTVIL